MRLITWRTLSCFLLISIFPGCFVSESSPALNTTSPSVLDQTSIIRIKDRPNIASNRNVTSYGGTTENLEYFVDEDTNTFATYKSYSSDEFVRGWVKVKFDGLHHITKVSVKIHIVNGNVTGTAQILLLEALGDTPEPLEHYSCLRVTVPKDDIFYFPQVDCSSTRPQHAIALWIEKGFDLLQLYEVEVEGYPSSDPMTTDSSRAAAIHANIFEVSTTVLLGGQVLVLLIQRFAQ